MAKINTDNIQNFETSWEGYAGSSIENFIKDELLKSCGFITVITDQQNQNTHYLYGFRSEEDYNNWHEFDANEENINKENPFNPLFITKLPDLENQVNMVKLITNSNTDKIIDLGDGIKVNLKYISYVQTIGSDSAAPRDNTSAGTLYILQSVNNAPFTEVKQISLSPNDWYYSTDWENVWTPGDNNNNDNIVTTHNNYYTIDISSLVKDGDNAFKFYIKESETKAVSNQLVFKSVVKTKLKLTNNTSVKDSLKNPINLSYYIEGNVNKTLNVKITQNNISHDYSQQLGQNIYIQTPYDKFPAITTQFDTGKIEIESWLTVDGFSYLESNHTINQFYYINYPTNDPVIILNNKNITIDNYSNTHFFDFALFNDKAKVDIVITNNTGSQTYLSYTFNECEVGKEYSFNNILQIEDNDNEQINGKIKIYLNDIFTDSYDIIINNFENMSPISGADFILNPAIRNNYEKNPNKIINATNDEVIESTFKNFNFINDGWIQDEDGYSILRIPSKRSLEINYNPLDSISTGTTIELDYKIYNIFEDDDIVLKILNKNFAGKPMGFIMNATEAVFYTEANQMKRDQDVMFQEDVRTHMAINIVPNLGGKGLNYIRIFINGVLNREMTYEWSTTYHDTFSGNNLATITIGADDCDCDIDIYSIKIYKKSLSESDIRQNYMGSIPTIEGKLAFKNANDILDDNGTISFDKAYNKYNTLLWIGEIPSYSNQNKYTGTLKINKIGDPEHSGKITNLTCKGQGSSSKTYWKWNQQYDWDIKDDDDNVIAESVWKDGNGDEHRDGYKLTNNDPAAKKLVAKLNWASSMQSHKQGSTALYTDLWREIVGGNSITKTSGYEDVRVSVHEEPFLFFVQDNEHPKPVFYGLMTFGSGKFDKPTFGYDKNKFPDYLIIEGTDNGVPLTLRQVPWFEDEVTYNDDKKAEYYEYAGQGNWDYGMGNQNNYIYFRNANNFVYLHSPRLKPYTNDNELIDKSYQYWYAGEDKKDENGNIIITKGDVKRFNYTNIGTDENGNKIVNGTWVNAGITKDVNTGEYAILNIGQQTGIALEGNDYEKLNKQFIQWRITDFKHRIREHYNVDDVLYSMAFLKLIGASDNRCKNTYEYLDPVTHKICMVQDDMDTIMLTDNVGRKTKPYYVEEHDTYVDSENIRHYYFNGANNNFFTLMDYAFSTELKDTMASILNTMKTEKFTGKINGNVEDCLQKYFYSIQEYFPAIAYNETARLLYEEASVEQSLGNYSNGTPAISQSLGNQLEAEKQWFKRRLIYLQSWSGVNPFSVGSKSFNFRSIRTSKDTDPSYTFTIQPWQYLYPKLGIGQTINNGQTIIDEYIINDQTEQTDLYKNRTSYNDTYTNETPLGTDGNTNVFIYGLDYIKSIGEFGNKPVGEAFILSSKKLIEFSADQTEINGETYEFRPKSIEFNCPSLKKLSLNGCSSLSGLIDLQYENKLEKLDLRNCGNITSVILPQTGTLTDVYLPNSNSIATLYMVNCPNVDVTKLEGFDYSHITSLTTSNSHVAYETLINSNNLSIIKLQNIDLDLSEENISVAQKIISLLLSKNNKDINDNINISTGKINISNYELPKEDKEALNEIYGNIDDENGLLNIIYYYTIGNNTVYIDGPNEIAEGREAEFTVNYSGNSASNFVWRVINNQSVISSMSTNRNKCKIKLNKNIDLSVNRTVTIQALVTRMNNSAITVTKEITIREDNFINEIILNNGNEVILDKSQTEYSIPISYNAHTSNITNIEYSLQDDLYNNCSIVREKSDYNKIVIKYNNIVEYTSKTLKLIITVTDDNPDNTNTTQEFDIKLINPVNKLMLESKIIWERTL